MSKSKRVIANNGRKCAAVLLALAAVNIALGAATEVKHPWYDGRLKDARREKTFVKPLMALSDEQVIELIPARKPFQGRVSMSSMLEDKAWWKPSQPKHVTVGKETFIPEERWPVTDKQTVTGPDGKVWTYEYMKDKLGEPFYPGCARDFLARKWFVDAALWAAQIYHTTGEKAYAHKAALIIARFAQIYPSYPISGSLGSAGPRKFFAKEPYPVTSAKWNYSVMYMTDGSSFEPLVLAYDLICPSGEIEDLSRQWKRDLRQEIEEGFFLDHCKLMMKYDRWYANKPNIALSNLQPYKCRVMIAVGRTIGNPDVVHYAYECLSRLIDATLMVDGVLPQSPDYHLQEVGHTQVATRFLKGYSDPKGYTHARSGHRFDNYDPENDMPILRQANQFDKDARYPNGRLMIVHDTWPKDSPNHGRTQTTSRIWPAFGHAILGRGSDDSQMEAHLHFSGSHGHAHADTLNLGLWAFGEELLSDIGYTHTYRGWAGSSLSHNLVVVDGASQYAGSPKITAWSPMQKGFGVVEAQGMKCYTACSAYSRAIIMIEHSPSAAFCVDIFTVVGGTQHDWLAHGSADKDQTLQFDKSDKPFADSLAADGKIHNPRTQREVVVIDGKNDVREAKTEVSPYWGNIRHIKKVDGPGPWRATFAGSQETNASLRLHLLTPKDCQLYAGEAPSIRRAQEKDSQVEKYMMPILTARRELKVAGNAPIRSNTKAVLPGISQQLSSRYVAVWEPFRGQPWIEKADVLYDAWNGVALSVQAGGAKYLILWSPEGSNGFVLPGGVTFSGRFGCLRQEGQQQNLSVIGPGAFYGYANAPRLTPIRPLALADVANEKGLEYMVFQSGPIQLPDPAWGILWHPDGYRRAVRLGRCFSQAGNLKIECPDGLGLVRGQGKQVWQETCFPARSFQGPMTLEIVQRMDMAFSTAPPPQARRN